MDPNSENAPHIVIELDRDLRVTGWNRRAEAVLGIPGAAALGRGIAELVPLRGAPGWAEALAAESKAPQVRALAREGAPLHLELWWQVTPGAGATLYGLDVSARTADERRAAIELSMFHAILHNLEIVTWAIDAKGVFLYQDGKGLAKTGMTPHLLVGQNVLELYKQSGADSDLQRSLAGEAILGTESEAHDLMWKNWFIPVDASSEARVVGVSLDVSDAARREAELLAKIEVIEKQQEIIRELSTPIIEVWDGVITLPLVGVIDSTRTREIMENLLQTVSRLGVRYVILDLTGVEVVDTGTASHLIGMIRALRLLGAEGILTGIHPIVAQTVVSLEIDLSRVIVHAKLRDALQYCISELGRSR